MAKVISINISSEKGVPKTPIERGYFAVDCGLSGDAHSGTWHRQVSLLAVESIYKMRENGLGDIALGSFAENITTEGILLWQLPVDTQIKLGEATLIVTQIGKECHSGCSIRELVGDCVMPREGIFAKVVTSGWVQGGDEITIMAGVNGKKEKKHS